MSEKQDVRMPLSDLGFVEELSDIELEAVVGGQALPTPRTGIPKLDNFLSNLRNRAEGRFREQFPQLTLIVFPSSRN